MTAEEFLIKKNLMKEGGKVLLETIHENTKLINLALLLDEYFMLKLNKDLYDIERALKDSDYEG